MYANTNGYCPACQQPFGNKWFNHKSTHHIWPKRYYHGAGKTIELCRSCHNEADKFIENIRAAEPSVYEHAFNTWLASKQTATQPT